MARPHYRRCGAVVAQPRHGVRRHQSGGGAPALLRTRRGGRGRGRRHRRVSLAALGGARSQGVAAGRVRDDVAARRRLSDAPLRRLEAIGSASTALGLQPFDATAALLLAIMDGLARAGDALAAVDAAATRAKRMREDAPAAGADAAAGGAGPSAAPLVSPPPTTEAKPTDPVKEVAKAAKAAEKPPRPRRRRPRRPRRRRPPTSRRTCGWLVQEGARSGGGCAGRRRG